MQLDNNIKKNLSPLMRQYWDIKETCPNDILLFRMGDFYELFDEDAVKAAPIIGLTLTARNKKSGDTTPMCGFPHHSMAGPIQKLLAANLRVSICDQVEEASQAKGLVKRKIIRRLSPGMVYDPETLDQRSGHYMMSYDEDYISFLDSTTGEGFYYPNDQDYDYYFESFNVVELVLSSKQSDLPIPSHICKTIFDLNKIKNGQDRLLAYVRSTQGDDFDKTFIGFQLVERANILKISGKVFKHLEVFKNYEGEVKGSLFDSINKTLTPAGSRRLKSWLRAPLSDYMEIEKRQNQVLIWSKDFLKLKKMREILRNLGDLERRTLKVTSPSCGPRDLLRLADSLNTLLGLSSFIQFDKKAYQSVFDIHQLITISINEESPVNFSSGQFINKGYKPEIDEVIDLAENAQTLISAMESKEKEQTGISSLKIRYNSVFGFYIEVSKANSQKVPTHYIRKQTLVSSERYTTEKLQELEEKVLSSKTKRIDLELAVLDEIKQNIILCSKDFLSLCSQVAEVDVLASFAWLSIEKKYIKADLSPNGNLELIKSRHPVVEVNLSSKFIPNDIFLEKGQCFLITGPNMAGKSTLMRQVALSVLLNQIGSFVPATEARLPIYKTLHTRIGASDFLSQGLSTFMVEMSETAELLNQSGPESLIILDEIGRGTSTYDGLSLAQAILEALLNKGSSFMFSTHYQELTRLDSTFKKVKNMNMGVKKEKDKIFFEYLLKNGAAEKSYGIEVARLAGVEKTVVERAKELLLKYEKDQHQGQLDLFGEINLYKNEKSSLKYDSSKEFFPEQIMSDKIKQAEKYEDLIDQIKKFAISSATPLEALNEISKWQKNL